MTVDLHIHTTASDGSLSPVEVVQAAAGLGLKTISLTDHESVDGCAQAALAGKPLGVRVIPGVELLTTYRGREVHLLGYWVDVTSPVLSGRLRTLREQRNLAAQEMVARLQQQGFEITWIQVQGSAAENGVICKNHILHAIREAGYIQTRLQALEILKKYLGKGGLAYVDFTQHQFIDAVELIRQSGGIPVVAHPALIYDDDLLGEILGNRPIGLEVYYYYLGEKKAEWVQRYEKIAYERNLLATGGTDFHGGYAPVALGEMQVPERVVTDLEKYYQKTIPSRRTL